MVSTDGGMDIERMDIGGWRDGQEGWGGGRQEEWGMNRMNGSHEGGWGMDKFERGLRRMEKRNGGMDSMGGEMNRRDRSMDRRAGG